MLLVRLKINFRRSKNKLNYEIFYYKNYNILNSILYNIFKMFFNFMEYYNFYLLKSLLTRYIKNYFSILI